MRIGTNPEKNKGEKIKYKQHRIIIPVYIPDSDDLYFDNLFNVLKVSLQSLISTTNVNQTNITIINNNCNDLVTRYIDSLLDEKKIDKHVKLANNYGKIYTVLSEAKASYENLITIADADVFYFSHWLENTIHIFNTYKKAGVVAPLPMPQLAYYCNNSLFSNEILKINKGKIVEDKELLLFEESVNGKISRNKNNWFKRQFFLEKKKLKACVGAGHFIATYRKEVIDNLGNQKPEFVFKNGKEKDYIDNPIDKLGYYRLSTIKTFAYHLGNTIPKWTKKYNFEQEKAIFEIKKYKTVKTYLPFKVKEIITKIYRKLIVV